MSMNEYEGMSRVAEQNDRLRRRNDELHAEIRELKEKLEDETLRADTATNSAEEYERLYRGEKDARRAQRRYHANHLQKLNDGLAKILDESVARIS